MRERGVCGGETPQQGGQPAQRGGRECKVVPVVKSRMLLIISNSYNIVLINANLNIVIREVKGEFWIFSKRGREEI